MAAPTIERPFKISTLIFLRNEAGEVLMMQRKKSPNFGLWSCIGGKLEMPLGESPHETAVREVGEETGIELQISDLHLFGMITERNYENRVHWLMFMFDCRKRLTELPPDIDEGHFAFHPEDAWKTLPIPETDRQSLWPLWHERRDAFTVLRADCNPDIPLEVMVEEEM